MTEQQDNDARKGWVKAIPYAMFAAYALGPLLLIPAVSSPWPVVAYIFAVAIIAGLIDGIAFRPNWSLPLLTGVGFWIAKALYFNDGTFFYSIAVTLTCAAAMGLGSLVGGSSSRSNAEV
ncbi:hypothetical protein NUW87_01130 [Corynebacterium pilbarense]|uniref:Uncharacterized protein n=1 Tax=Corynebacterium pilbarense TaxID=1288393 RepID=A0A9Q4IFF4_9CORY|nr:hypothetical protein [Corynebacterium pilbarense]MCG7296285.1 hypothetical protein [Corynebacterium afermentans]MCZ2219979.1 hypothetical protein [Corynebacterium pilbarense]